MTCDPARPLIEVRRATKRFDLRRRASGGGSFVAIDNVSFDIARGEILGCVGETGSGKSTLGRMILNLVAVDAGEVSYEGRRVDTLSAPEMRPLRRELQIVFQDSLQAMNARRSVAENLIQPLLNFGVSRPRAYARLAETLALVGMDIAHAGRYPHEFSGGQCQRMGIARALMVQPRFIFLDEPVSALDVSIQAQIINLLLEIKRRFDLTYLFVSHDLGIVRYVSDRVIVLYRGRIVEIGDSDALYTEPLHPYTRALGAAALTDDNRDGWKQVARQFGALAEADAVAADAGGGRPGCIYAQACPHRHARCDEEVPELRAVAPRRFVACHLVVQP
jgi:oligopeptide/dipeptide ABC transporter ATP-binding protein